MKNRFFAAALLFLSVVLAGCTLPQIEHQDWIKKEQDWIKKEKEQNEIQAKLMERQRSDWMATRKAEHERLLQAVRESEAVLARCREAKEATEAELVALMEKDPKSGADLLRIDDLKIERRSLMEMEPRCVENMEACRSATVGIEDEWADKERSFDAWIAHFRKQR